ncbi:MAG: hypothetical protein ABI405_12290 [Parafilimonas sp.]
MQNRVNPFGEIIQTTARGLWMGNRGHIHNLNCEIVRQYKLKAWIICKLEFKERKRRIMAPNLYTELFFMDEATAFAAGHRPCFECRREDYSKFKTAWLKGNPQYKFTDKTSIRNIDEILHHERMNKDASKKTFQKNSKDLPNGTFISIDNNAYLVFNKHMYLWSAFGYKKYELFSVGKSNVLTPESVVNTFSAGYIPQMNIHETLL